MRRAAVYAAYAAILALGTARVARASGEEDRRTARYQEGVDAATARRWDVARDRFAAALAIRESPKVLFSLAQAEEHVGALARASAHYARALETAKAAGESDVVGAAEGKLAELTPRVPSLRIVVSGAKDWTLTLDGQPVASASPIPVDPGTHRVVADAPGMHEAVATIALSEGQSLEVPLHLEAAATSAADHPARASSGTSPWHWAAIATAGAGVVVAGIGGYFGLEAKSKLDESNRDGCQGNACPPGAIQVRRDALSAATGSDVAFGVGGALVAAGVALWVLAPSSSSVAGARVGVAPGALVVRAVW